MEAMLDKWLWRHEYWLPPGVTWADMKVEEGSRTPLPRDLLITLPLALAFIALRYVFNRLVAVPLSRQLGVRDRIRVQATPVPILEAFYAKNRSQPPQSAILNLVKQCDLTQRQIETWFRLRRNQDKPTNTRKFCEACWRFVFYLLAFSAGLASLIDKPWFWDQRECWRGYPQQSIEEAHYWYYVIELSFYWSLLFCVSVDVKRKDFKEQIVHHVATIFLIGFSYCSNYLRIGTLVMLIHDSSDFLLESAKMFNYAGWRKIGDGLFVLFAAVFLFTRLVVFPSKVIHSTLVFTMEVFKPFFGYYLFNFLLMVLQVLHIFWAWLIVRMIYKFAALGTVERDERSDDDSETDHNERGEEEESSCWQQRKSALNSKMPTLANSCVLNNLTNQSSNSSSRKSKAR